MICALAVALGGSARALRIARKVNQFVLWFTPLDIRRALRTTDEEIEALEMMRHRAA